MIPVKEILNVFESRGEESESGEKDSRGSEYQEGTSESAAALEKLRDIALTNILLKIDDSCAGTVIDHKDPAEA